MADRGFAREKAGLTADAWPPRARPCWLLAKPAPYPHGRSDGFQRIERPERRLASTPRRAVVLRRPRPKGLIICALARLAESWGMKIKLIKHEVVPKCGSFEVRFPDARPSQYFYWDDIPGRRLRPDSRTQEQRHLPETSKDWDRRSNE
jgi:hypothetical protein